MTTNVHNMNVLLVCINSYCQWAGVKINMGKAEVTGYGYKKKPPNDRKMTSCRGATAKLHLGDGADNKLGGSALQQCR